MTVEINWTVHPVETPIRVEFDVNSDGVPEWTESGFGRKSYTYEREGEYQFTVRVHDRSGLVTVYTAPVTVVSRTALTADLEGRWASMKAALRRGDIAAAVECIHSSSRNRYQTQFSRFSPATLANIDLHMTTIQLVKIGRGGAEYEMLRQRDGQPLSFAVWFQVDWDGVWRVLRF